MTLHNTQSVLIARLVDLLQFNLPDSVIEVRPTDSPELQHLLIEVFACDGMTSVFAFTGPTPHDSDAILEFVHYIVKEVLERRSAT